MTDTMTSLNTELSFWDILYNRYIAKLEEKRPLGTGRHRHKGNIKLDLGELGWGIMEWIHLA
jgi:hypothetical protein